MDLIRKNAALVMTIIGAALAAQAIVWEVVRVRPDFRFLVSPWSIRGLDTPQMRAVSVMAAGIIVLAILARRDVSEERAGVQGRLLAGAALLGAVAIALVANPEPRNVELSTFGGLAVAFAGAFVLVRLVVNMLSPRVQLLQNRVVSPVAWIVLAIVGYLLIVNPLLVDERVEIRLWLVVLLAFGAPLALAVTSPPAELVPNRVLVLSVLGTWAVATLAAGAVRSTLVRHQLAELGVSAQYKDVQITWGLMLAWLGLGLAFVGSVAMWARRRDLLVARRRAAQQRAAAEASLAELQTG